jgi:hypothetical protein
MNNKQNKKTSKLSWLDNDKVKDKANLNKTHMPTPNKTISSKIYLSKN